MFLLENKALITVGETISNVAMRYTTIDEGESRQEVDFVPLDRMFCVSSVDMNIECSRLLQEARSSERCLQILRSRYKDKHSLLLLSLLL